LNLVLRSTYGHGCAVDFDWPWCPPAAAGQAIDLRIVLGSLGPFAGADPAAYVPYRQRAGHTPADPPIVRVARGADGHFLLTYCDGARFAIDATGSEIFGVAGPAQALDDLLVYLQGPILGFALRLRGVTCLHASAAVCDGRAFGVLGAGGMGKSTSAAIFAGLGLPVLTDDVLALVDRGDTFDVQPGLPSVLLWSDSVRELFGDGEALPRIVGAGSWDKRYLDLTRPGYSFGREAAPLRALYVLGERLPRGAAPELTPLRGAVALPFLLANTYANDFLDTAARARELDVLGRLVSHLPIRLVRAPEAPDGAADTCRATCRAMLADFREVA
jgi:hypothetical protein